MENFGLYLAYGIAAAAMLALKLVNYLRNSEKYGKTAGQSLREWFFERSLENAASWLATGLVVWVLGYIYIEQAIELTGVLGKTIAAVPVSIPTAALAGCLNEIIAPAVFKKVLGLVKSKLE